ncbi:MULTISPECIES: Dyp-type peroxidase [Dietzia]|uniref:Dyp-type peroxidase n=1 Tax=Dietzia cinnamea TaxID=321318 RepID=A0AAW5QA60_9ACTN|nr:MULTISPECIES: Dyp-type peroxidase [Dietzia]PWD96880.1 Dyp-type peroxidase [Dietzia maris]AVM63683.1 peroxidase [Dietzia sp. oral taxon 368]MBM7230280.1 Dyp-type peroxidase [Dietzia cinnamea]MCT1638841.1 Dyp-type peroxidase [Dietzia cinnamea]MCT1711126.1 Dyp-type peroxidase [Dietzia cinnamea]
MADQARRGLIRRGLSRRSVLTGGVAAVVGGGVVGGAAGYAGRGVVDDDEAIADWKTVADSRVVGTTTEPFHGPHQSGITTAPQSHAAFVAFDIIPGATRTEIQGVLRAWSQDAARLTQGRGGLADLEPELAEDPARLTVTIGLGPGFFDAAGLPEKRPSWLAQLPAFPQIDQLEDRWSEGDLLLQICADDPLIVSHAARILASGVRGVARQRWAQRGFRKAVGTDPSGRTQRNLFGQIDGTENPRPDDVDFDQILFSDGSEQRWMRGGSSLVLRRIRMTMDTWEEIDRTSRELSVGRRLDTGAPLTGRNERDPADFELIDETGLPVIPPESHMARARQRNRGEAMLRRPYNYDDPPEDGEISNSGLLFTAYQADPVRTYIPVQRRLAEQDALNTWTIPIGSAVFALPPGAPEGGYVGQTLFEG